MLLEVSKSRKQILKFSFELKNEGIFFLPQLSKIGQIKKQMQIIILDDK